MLNVTVFSFWEYRILKFKLFFLIWHFLIPHFLILLLLLLLILHIHLFISTHKSLKYLNVYVFLIFIMVLLLYLYLILFLLLHFLLHLHIWILKRLSIFFLLRLDNKVPACTWYPRSSYVVTHVLWPRIERKQGVPKSVVNAVMQIIKYAQKPECAQCNR